jgi:hypothetical protein
MTKEEAQKTFNIAAGCYNRALAFEKQAAKAGEWNNAESFRGQKSEAMSEMWKLLAQFPSLDQSKVA